MDDAVVATTGGGSGGRGRALLWVGIFVWREWFIESRG
jgi:hypothetical protein